MCTDVELSKGSIRLHPVDLLPPSNTPMIGRHDPNYDGFTKLVPPQFHGIAPPTQSAPQNVSFFKNCGTFNRYVL